jgi:hypothetical protein
VADQVMQENGNAEDARSVRLTTGSLFGRLQRKCDACEEEEEEVQRKEEGGSSPGTTMAPINVREALDSPGQPLDVSTRAFFEPRFGYDFGNVRLHTGTQAADSARAINAKAYTAGNHIVMGQGQYDPTQVRGQQLLAHELTHVIQQANGGSDIRKIARAPLSVQRDGGKVTDPLELMEGVTEASVYMIVIDNSSGRTRFYTRGGKTINGKLVQLTSTFKPGEYLLKRSESEDKKRTWDIEYPDGKTYRGGLEFEVQLDGVNFNSISYTPKVQLRVASGILPTLIDIDQRIKAIKDEVSKKLVNNKEEQAILQLLSDIPPEQAEEFVKKMREEMVGELPLLERLDRDIDGENNIALHEALSRLKLQAGGVKSAAALAEAPTLAWHDVMGFFEQKAVFSVTRRGKGKIHIRYLGGIAGGLYSNPQYSEIRSLNRKDRLNMMTGGIEVDADQPIIIHDYDNDRQVILVAEDLIAYQHAGVRKFLQDVGTIASLATPAGAETVGGRVLAYGIQIATVATTIVDENKLNIRKWFPKWGPAIIEASEKIKLALAVVGIAQLVKGGWGMFANLRRIRNARAAMEAKAVATTAEELAKAEQQAARLESQADDLLRQAELARKELGVADDVIDSAGKTEAGGGALKRADDAHQIPSPGHPPPSTSAANKTRIIDAAIEKKDFTGEFAALANREVSANAGKMRPSTMSGYSVEVPIEGTEHFLARSKNGTWCLFSGTPKGCGVINIAKEVDELVSSVGEIEQITAKGKALGYSEKDIQGFINLKGKTTGMTVEQLLEEMAEMQGKGLSVEMTKKQMERLQRVSEALNDESKWVNISPKDRWRLGRAYDKLLEGLVSEGIRRTNQPVLHYVEINAALIKKLRESGGLRVDMVEIDFSKAQAELIDLTATSSAKHLEKTRSGKTALEKLLGMPITAKEMHYTGPKGELLDDLVEVIVP